MAQVLPYVRSRSTTGYIQVMLLIADRQGMQPRQYGHLMSTEIHEYSLIHERYAQSAHGGPLETASPENERYYISRITRLCSHIRSYLPLQTQGTGI